MVKNVEPNQLLSSSLQLRAEVEAFLYWEAELLDDWKLNEWAELFTDDGVNRVPPLSDSSLSPANSLFVVADNKTTLLSRVSQLLGGTAWSESPRSKTRRLITNVRLVSIDSKATQSRANFLVHRTRRANVSTFVGEYHHRLVRHNDSFKIAERTVILTQDEFSQGALSFIL